MTFSKWLFSEITKPPSFNEQIATDAKKFKENIAKVQETIDSLESENDALANDVDDLTAMIERCIEFKNLDLLASDYKKYNARREKEAEDVK